MADPPMAFYTLMEYLPMTQLVAGGRGDVVYAVPDPGRFRTLMIAEPVGPQRGCGHDAPELGCESSGRRY